MLVLRNRSELSVGYSGAARAARCVTGGLAPNGTYFTPPQGGCEFLRASPVTP
ncbi:hypothetical protein RB10136 [Rhodopirellula baltica SH 1]|uniref:Uncharacterized protein n=1 Tax=Rhodopirellula baltica (strain DSM 10527 / NCIMB 13988 / SH1) TaxID=243090 RepID=Q7UFG0_RHOBA|nr:hypothetical protein RB10136 [Rhodopirellula baltica SH 1]